VKNYIAQNRTGRKIAMNMIFGLEELPTRKPRISVVVDEDLLEYLEQWAGSEERSVSNLVVFLLKQAVEARELNRQQVKKNK
jgi:hypothetical protein